MIFGNDEKEKEIERIDKVKAGIEFILSHFEGRQPLFPRKMSTTFSDGRQFAVYNEGQMLNECIKANFIDCRINAYPIVNDSAIPLQAPNIIFIDLDLNDDLPYGNALNLLNKSKNKSIKTIKDKLGGCVPTVLWTGNGYHIYIVLETRPLELIEELNDFSTKSSEEFLRYGELVFSNRKKDSGHNPSFGSSLLRIPYTFNSKNNAEIKIVQEFDMKYIPSLHLDIVRNFRLWLVDDDLREKRQRLRNSRYIICSSSTALEGNRTKNCFWIDKLLATPIPCYRRYCLYHIAVPYLINVRKLSHEECYGLLNTWLEKCNRLSKLSFDLDKEVKTRLKGVKDYKPLSINKIRKENVELYNMIANEIYIRDQAKEYAF